MVWDVKGFFGFFCLFVCEFWVGFFSFPVGYCVCGFIVMPVYMTLICCLRHQLTNFIEYFGNYTVFTKYDCTVSVWLLLYFITGSFSVIL